MKSKEIKQSLKKGEQIRSKEQIAKDCAAEVNEVLKKYNCATSVDFVTAVVLGSPVLKYETKIVFKG
jgi:hypothetical protein